jgi:hypothetical protein
MKLFVAVLLAFPLFAQNQPDLVIDGLTLNSTLLNHLGTYQVTASFRVLNSGSAASPATHTLVQFSTGQPWVSPQVFSLATPAIAVGQAVYVTEGVAEVTPQITVSIVVDAQSESTESNESNNTFSGVVQLQHPELLRWQSIGPSRFNWGNGTSDVGRTTAILVDPRTSNTVYAGARHSGLWKTADGGQTWYPLSDSLPTLTVSAAALDPDNPDRLLMATPSGLFQTTNGGAVWTLLNSVNLNAWGSDGGAMIIAHKPELVFKPAARLVGGIGMLPVAQQPIYVSTLSKGVIVSQNNGASWTTVAGARSPIGSIKLSEDQSTVWATVSTGGPAPVGLYRGDNGGLHASDWHQLVGCPAGPLPAIPSSSRVFVGESQGTVWMSYVAGSAQNQQHQILHTTGATCTVNGRLENIWQNVPLSGNCDFATNQWSYLFVHPSDPSIVFKGGIELCRSASGGAFKTEDGPHNDHHAIAVYPANPAIMFEGNDGGLYRSTNNGATWQFFGEGLAVTEFLNLDVSNVAGRLVAGGSQDNDGQGWDGVSMVWNHAGGGGTDIPLLASDGTNPANLYKMGQSTLQIVEHFPNGTRQTVGAPPLPDVLAYDETPGLFASMVATGATAPLAVTAHGLWTGPPWTQVMAPPVGGNFNRLQHGPSQWVAGTDNGLVFAGPTLSSLTQVLSVPGSQVTAIATGSGFFYVAFTGPHLYECTGTTCKEVTHPGAGSITAMVMDGGNPNQLIIAVAGAGVFLRTNIGLMTQWTRLNNGLPADIVVTDLKQMAPGRVVLGSYGRGAFVINTPVQLLVEK